MADPKSDGPVVTPLMAMRERLGVANVLYAPGCPPDIGTSHDRTFCRIETPTREIDCSASKLVSDKGPSGLAGRSLCFRRAQRWSVPSELPLRQQLPLRAGRRRRRQSRYRHLRRRRKRVGRMDGRRGCGQDGSELARAAGGSGQGGQARCGCQALHRRDGARLAARLRMVRSEPHAFLSARLADCSSEQS